MSLTDDDIRMHFAGNSINTIPGVSNFEKLGRQCKIFKVVLTITSYMYDNFNVTFSCSKITYNVVTY